ARKLGLTEKPPAPPAATLEITALGDVGAGNVGYTLGASSKAAGRGLSQLALPESVVIAMIARDTAVIPPRGSTRLHTGDSLFVVIKPETRAFVDYVFSDASEIGAADLPPQELRVKGSNRVEHLLHSYGLDL